MKRFIILITNNNITRLFVLTLLILLLGALGLSYFEDTPNIVDAFWWSFVTITTVGYGDIAPSTFGGRITGIIVMVFGIGLLGMFTATIASAFITAKIKEGRGVIDVKVKNHFIVCGWSYKAKEIIDELRADKKVSDKPIVLLADIPEKPFEDKNTFFIHGEPNAETAKKANLEYASVVIILLDERLDSYSRDAKAVLNTLTIRTLNPNVYVCLEISDLKNMQHGKMAGANEIIVVGELSSNLLVQSALDHGITQIITELVSNQFGSALYKIPAPGNLIGQRFVDVLTILKSEYNAIVLAVESPAEKKFMANPHMGYTIRSGDQLVVIAQERPNLGAGGE
ncbi:MAG: cag pathogenicity island protein Cag26 [Planctomycetes bacterium]|nr:cag pathogenicity island protein Cag26 [Planctomycetota bacterium]